MEIKEHLFFIPLILAPFLPSVTAETDDALDGAAAAFGLSAAITTVFNTDLASVKDACKPLNSFMASLTGHHRHTHGLADIVVFLWCSALCLCSASSAWTV